MKSYFSFIFLLIILVLLLNVRCDDTTIQSSSSTTTTEIAAVTEAATSAVTTTETSTSTASTSSSSETIPIAVTTITSPPVKVPTAAPSAEGTESTAPSIPDEEEGNFVPITDIQGSQVPSATPTFGKEEVSIVTKTIDSSEPAIITEKEVVVEQSSSFIRTLLFIVMIVIAILFMYRRFILKYFERRVPYGTNQTLPVKYSQVPTNER